MSSRIGQIIAELRKEAGYTQKSLAQALNITDKAVSKWERELCLPDISLLPKLSLLLDADIDFLLGNHESRKQVEWAGVIDLSLYSHVDLQQKVYDKPLVYYLLVHFILLGIREICVLTGDKNKEYLESERLQKLGVHFFYSVNEVSHKSLMIMDKPYFLFGSDLTHRFQAAMAADYVTAMVPDGIGTVCLFVPAKYVAFYENNQQNLHKITSCKALGRGMVCQLMDDDDKIVEIANFVKMYQKASGLSIASLEEIVMHKKM